MTSFHSKSAIDLFALVFASQTSGTPQFDPPCASVDSKTKKDEMKNFKRAIYQQQTIKRHNTLKAFDKS